MRTENVSKILRPYWYRPLKKCRPNLLKSVDYILIIYWKSAIFNGEVIEMAIDEKEYRKRLIVPITALKP